MTYKERLPKVRAVLLDVDGVFTDNRVLLYPGLDPVRSFHSRDLFAVQHAIKEGLRVVIITGGKSLGTQQTFERLGVTEYFCSVRDKSERLNELEGQGLDLTACAYMGDDLPDLRAMKRVGLACCPSDAAAEIKSICHYVSPHAGGHGCVRDLLEQTLKVQGRWVTEGAHTW
jgi:3-deoxy-D-manno-octulosonate 8-phosphate phosphatase (KDO 8-P phosphatase)